VSFRGFLVYVLLAAGGLAAISIAVLRAWRRAAYLAVGWFWYLATLLPVIGLIQVGAQARADRYTYVPMIGLAIAPAWSAGDLLRRSPCAQAALAAVALACIPMTSAQVAYWRNSETLFRHALEVTSGNDVAEHNLGNYLMGIPGRLPEAIEHLEASLRINPWSAKTRADLGTALQPAWQAAPGSRSVSSSGAAGARLPDFAQRPGRRSNRHGPVAGGRLRISHGDTAGAGFGHPA
jgi:hypothetical protein